MRVRQLTLLASLMTLLLCSSHLAAASDRGSLIVRSNPKDAYVYADGEPVVLGQRVTTLPSQPATTRSTSTTTASGRRPAP